MVQDIQAGRWSLFQLRALSKRADFYTHDTRTHTRTHARTHTHILSLSKGMSVSLSSEQKLKQALLKALSKRADFFTHTYTHTHRDTETHTQTHTHTSLSLIGNVCQLSSEQNLKQAPLKALSKRADFYKHTHTNTHILSLSLKGNVCQP